MRSISRLGHGPQLRGLASYLALAHAQLFACFLGASVSLPLHLCCRLSALLLALGVMRQAAELSGGAELVLTHWREGHWLFARQPLVHFGFDAKAPALAQAADWLRAHPQDFALVPQQALGECFLAAKARRLGETSRSKFFLVGVDADNGQCHAEPPARVYRFAWRTPPL